MFSSCSYLDRAALSSGRNTRRNGKLNNPQATYSCTQKILDSDMVLLFLLGSIAYQSEGACLISLSLSIQLPDKRRENFNKIERSAFLLPSPSVGLMYLSLGSSAQLSTEHSKKGEAQQPTSGKSSRRSQPQDIFSYLVLLFYPSSGERSRFNYPQTKQGMKDAKANSLQELEVKGRYTDQCQTKTRSIGKTSPLPDRRGKTADQY